MKEIQISLDVDSQGRAVLRMSPDDLKRVIIAIRETYLDRSSAYALRFEVKSQAAKELLE